MIILLMFFEFFLFGPDPIIFLPLSYAGSVDILALLGDDLGTTKALVWEMHGYDPRTI